MINQPREMSALEELRVFTLTHFYMNCSEFVNGDGLTLQDKQELFSKYTIEVVTSVSAAMGFCSITDIGLEAIEAAFDEIVARGYSTFDRDSFMTDMQ